MKDHGCGSKIAIAAVLLTVLSANLRSEPAPAVCNRLPGAREELSLTPRADARLELLALSLSDGVTADQAIYERLLRDTTLIRRMESRLKGVDYRPHNDGKTLLLRLSENASARFADQNYHYWDCVNRHYRVESTQVIASNLVRVRFKGIYDLEKLATVYARLPGVLSVEQEETDGIDDGGTILVTKEEDVWHYVFRTPRAGAFYHFVTRSGQSPEPGGAWSGRASASPTWLRRYWFGTEPR